MHHGIETRWRTGSEVFVFYMIIKCVLVLKKQGKACYAHLHRPELHVHVLSHCVFTILIVFQWETEFCFRDFPRTVTTCYR